MNFFVRVQVKFIYGFYICNVINFKKRNYFKFLFYFILVVFDDEYFCYNNVYFVFKLNVVEVVVFELILFLSGINLVFVLVVNGLYYLMF